MEDSSVDRNRDRIKVKFQQRYVMSHRNLTYVVRRFGGTAIPIQMVQILPTRTLCTVFFISAVGEELGWSGYAIDPMQNRWDALPERASCWEWFGP